MSKYSLLTKLGADTTQFTRAMKKTRGESDAFGKHMMKLGGLMAGAFSVQAVVNFGKKAVELYNIQAQAEAKLKTALDGNIQSFTRLSKLASELQGKTLFGDEATIEAMSFLAQMNMTESEIRQLIPLIQDFAQAQNMDLGGAAKLVAKSFASSTNALSRYGIEISGAAGSSGRLSELTDKLNDMVGGQAAAAAETGTGAVTQLNNAWGDLAETIGSKLAPAINNAASASTTLLTDLNKIISSDNLNWWEKILPIFNPTGMGFGAALISDAVREVENANSEANTPDIPEWYSEMAQQWKAQAERDAAEISRRMTQVLTGPTSLQSKELMGVGTSPGFYDFFGQDMKAGKLAPLQNAEQNLAGYDAMAERLNEINQNLAASLSAFSADVLGKFAEDLGAGLANGTYNLEQALTGILGMFGDFVSQMGKMIVAYGIAMEGFKKAFTNPFVAIAAGLALIIAGSAIKSLAQQGPDMPALAEGGLAFGPTAAIVGDNPRASIDPEVIAPLSKLQGLTAARLEGNVTFKIAGSELKGVLRKYDNRYAGTN